MDTPPLENHVITFTDAPYEEPKPTYQTPTYYNTTPTYTQDDLVQELALYPHFAIGDKVVCETNNMGLCFIDSFEMNTGLVYKFKGAPSMVRISSFTNPKVKMLVSFPEIQLIY